MTLLLKLALLCSLCGLTYAAGRVADELRTGAKTPWHGSVPARERAAMSVPGNVLQDMWGSIPHRAPHTKLEASRQLQASVARPASEDNSASGSAKAQPGLIGGAA